MTYNVDAGGTRREWSDVVVEENPDVAVFVETGDWDDANAAKLNDWMAEFNARFSDSAPYTGDVTVDTMVPHTGLAILSRFPIIAREQLEWLVLDDGRTFRPAHAFMIWQLDVSGTPVHVVGVHLKCCSGPSNERAREAAIEGIVNYLNSLADAAIILAGDFNSFSPSDVGALAPRGDLGYGPLTLLLAAEDSKSAERASQQHVFFDVYRELNPHLQGYTYGHLDPSLSARLDYLIVNRKLLDRIEGPATVGDTPSALIGSDHLSLDVRISR